MSIILLLSCALTVCVCLGAQDSHEGLRAFDLELQELVERAKEEREVEGNGGEASPALLAEIGMRYWERDTRWLQGGLQEALTYMSRARGLTPPDKPKHLFTRTLHQGVLQSALGLLAAAAATFHAALEAAPGSGERASVLFHWGSMLAGREPEQSHARLIDSLRLGPCGPEAPSARMLLAQSYALLDSATEQGWRDIIRLLEEQSGGCAHISQSGQVSSATAQTHRALFVAEDALGQNRTKAWAHLLQANSDDLERLQRSPRVSLPPPQKKKTSVCKHNNLSSTIPPSLPATVGHGLLSQGKPGRGQAHCQDGLPAPVHGQGRLAVPPTRLHRGLPALRLDLARDDARRPPERLWPR